MEELRRAARESLQKQPDSHALPAIILPDDIAQPDSLNTLWQEISSKSPKYDAEVNVHVPAGLTRSDDAFRYAKNSSSPKDFWIAGAQRVCRNKMKRQ